MADLSRDEYAGRYGPTTDDRLRLGDTDLWVRVEDDHVGFGDEPIWGYAKNFRSRMAQFDRATAESELDMLIAGVVVGEGGGLLLVAPGQGRPALDAEQAHFGSVARLADGMGQAALPA